MSESRPGRPALTEEQREARRAKKNERNRNYYNSKKDEIKARRAERYDPEEAHQKYLENQEEITQRQRECYLNRRRKHKENLIEALEELGGVKDFKVFYGGLKRNIEGIHQADLEALTRLVLLHAFTHQTPVEMSEELVEIDPDTIPFTD